MSIEGIFWHYVHDILVVSLQDPMQPCPDVTGNITQYQISFQTWSVVDTENVPVARCTAGRCSHTFEPPSNPPSSYDIVSVAAENVVGVGAIKTCTTQPISELSMSHFSMYSIQAYMNHQTISVIYSGLWMLLLVFTTMCILKRRMSKA